MKGLRLSKRYYEEYGVEMIKREFSSYENRIAVGLIGEGSECFGFDDKISTDHDFGPSFMMWLTDEDYNKIGAELTASYERFPEEFMGYEKTPATKGIGRAGVNRIGDFYRNFIGKDTVPSTLTEWLNAPEHFLATATNGEIFRDDLGEMTKIRESLLNYYPEDIRIKKIAARASIMAQSGQYNYSRSMRRNETVAARLSLDEFIKNTISITYLLNKQYTPFYKWMHRGMENFKILPEMKNLIEELIYIPLQKEVYEDKDDLYFKYNINTDDKIVCKIEAICSLIVDEFKRQNLTDKNDSFLLNHTHSIMSRIKDDKIRSMHVMRG